MVLADSDRIARVPPYLGNPLGLSGFCVRDYHALWSAFPGSSANRPGPTAAPQPPCHLRGTGLGWSGFARHYSRNHSLFSFPQGTEMFHFPWLALSRLCIQHEVTVLSHRRVFPFGHLRINVRLATPRSFSQPPTSFIASWRLGIHRTPLVAYFTLISPAPNPCASRRMVRS
jgi:hypothetical protein